MRSCATKYLRANAASWLSVGMVRDLVPDDARGGLRAVLAGVVAQVGRGRMRPSHEDLVEAAELVAHLAEELMLRPNGAAVLGGGMRVGTHRADRRVLFVELKDGGRAGDRPRRRHGG